MKTELEIAKERIKELEALVKKLSSNLPVSSSIFTTSKAMDDYEFNMHRHWKDEPKQDDDDYGGTIKHFRD